MTAPSITEAAQGDGTTSSPEVEPVVRNDDGPTETTGGDEAIPVSVKPTRKKKVTVVVAGGLERVTPKPAIVTRPSNGGSASGGSSGGSASGGSSGGSGGSSGGGSSAGGSGGGNATPTTPDLGPLDGIGPGSVAGGGQQDNGDDEASAGG